MKYIQLLCRIGLIIQFMVTGVTALVKPSVISDNFMAFAWIAIALLIGYVYFPSFED